MSTNTTFDTLLQDLRQYLERGDSATTDARVFDQLPRLINMAERRIARELKVEGFVKVVTTVTIPGQSVYAKPDRWRDTVSMNIGTSTELKTRKQLFTRGYEYVRQFRPDESATAVPQIYADYDFSHWVIAPTPAIAHPWEISYYQLPELLDETRQVNWITEYAPELLLYGSLLEASVFLKNDERVAVWQQLYDRAAATLNGEDLAKILDRNSKRSEA
jgi:hypothetical protein